MRFLALFLSLFAMAASPQVEIRGSEVWLSRDGQSKYLTNDGKTKVQALLSPSSKRVAYYEMCPQSEDCVPSVVILDLEGNRIKSFVPMDLTFNEPCGQILYIIWVVEGAIGTVCHVSPSSSRYVETDISTGRTVRELGGGDFTPSPDGKQVAHAGWIPHFSPQYAQCDYLQLDNTTIYPLPIGTKPVEQKPSSGRPDVVRLEGLTFYGIHEFFAGFKWAPDAKRIALVDCTYDWTVDSPEELPVLSGQRGKKSNRRCSVAIVSPDGQFQLFPLPNVTSDQLYKSHLSWTTTNQLSLSVESETKTFTVQ